MRPRKRWRNAVAADFSRIGVQLRKMEAQDSMRWKAIVNAAKINPKLEKKGEEV